MRSLLCSLLCAFSVFSSPAKAHEVILTGGISLTKWERLRGPEQHDKWWANFIRASTLTMTNIRKRKPNERITWIVFRPSYITRSREEAKPILTWVEGHAKKYNAKLVWVSTAAETYAAINAAPSSGGLITKLTYFGHSNAYAFMLDYSNDIIGASTHWIHERDLRAKINRNIFAPGAEAWSYGCYTGRSMSRRWRSALGIPLWGNTEATRYGPLSQGRMPEGVGAWVK